MMAISPVHNRWNVYMNESVSFSCVVRKNRKVYVDLGLFGSLEHYGRW